MVDSLHIAVHSQHKVNQATSKMYQQLRRVQKYILIKQLIKEFSHENKFYIFVVFLLHQIPLRLLLRQHILV